MNISFDKKVAMVTGGTKGIGLGCAKMLATSDARVAVVGLDDVAEATESLQDYGLVKGYHVDLTDITSITKIVESIRRDLGEIDILVCSAGVDNSGIPADRVTETDWDFVQNVNAKGLFFSNQAVAVQSMIPRGRGAIVNIASTMSLVASPFCSPYCASKGAALQITRALALEWAPYNIRVNAVAPTWVLTDLSMPLLSDSEFKAQQIANIPLSRLATIDDVASAVCFLASEQASMLTGVALPVDGGVTAK